MITVLMYHAIPNGPVEADAADPHYSVAHGRFVEQLAHMSRLGLRPSSVRRLLDSQGEPGQSASGVGITFDDGHVTNLEAAARLKEVGGSADFFVNPAAVGTPGYLSWYQLREMAGWGMSIQSHGMQHEFLDEMTPAQVRHQLAASKNEIEQAIGQAVTLFAPTGGRQPAGGLSHLARELGYERICSSRVGLWNPAAKAWTDIPRLAMLQRTRPAQLQRWLTQSSLEMGWQQSRYAALRGAKQLLGNGFYVKLRSAMLGKVAR